MRCILHYRVLRKKSVLILDEPEINLHPEWQTEYARIIVMLQKELELHVVITTHSPFFLKALENAVSEYGIRDKFHYYYAQNAGGDALVEKADDDLEMVYSKMMMTLQLEALNSHSEDVKFRYRQAFPISVCLIRSFNCWNQGMRISKRHQLRHWHSWPGIIYVLIKYYNGLRKGEHNEDI